MIIGFIIGLSSALHCLGMCGPIAMAIPVNRKNNWTILWGSLQYNIGRIFTYTILGFIIGNVGFSVSGLQWMQRLSILAGVLIIVLAWRHVSLLKFNFLSSFYQKISKNIGMTLKSKHPFKLVVLGCLNGLLPCGMVFIALTNAMIQTSPLQGGLAMLAFGIGTLPMMLSVVFFASKLTGKWKTKINQYLPYFMTIIGLFIILRGMNLGIPMISPKIKTETNHQEKEQVELECCSSKSKDDTCEIE